METVVVDGGAGYPPEQFASADGATIENGKHTRREYDKVASEASARRQARAGPAAGEYGHGDTTLRLGPSPISGRARQFSSPSCHVVGPI